MTVPKVLHPFAAPARPEGEFLEIVRGEGCRLWDSEGRIYLDGTASLWYCEVGHGRREIADAVAAQMSQVAAYHTFGSFTNGPEQRLAEHAGRARADPRQPRAVHAHRLGVGRQRDEADARGPPGRTATPAAPCS